MKKLLLIFSVYVATFFIGVIFVIFLHFAKTKENIVEIPKLAEPKAELVELPKENFAPPKIFAVKNLFDESETKPNKHLIESGEINQNDIRIKSGKSWLGLFGDVGDSYLQQTKVLINQTDKSKLDWGEITIGGKETPLFLVKDLKKVKGGKITSLFFDKSKNEEGESQSTLIEKGFIKSFKLGEKSYILRVEEGLSEKQEPILVLLLEVDGKSQIIHYSYDDNYVGNLFWVGDLDSDGKLDFFMNFWNYEKGYYLSGLFLSSEAKKGQFVKRFEFLAYSGC